MYFSCLPRARGRRKTKKATRMCIFKCSSDMLPLLVHLNNMELRNTGPTSYDFRVRYVTFVKTDNLLRPLLIRESA